MAVEFALIAPFLLLLVVAVIDFGAAANRQMQLVGAVRAGAQLAVARPLSADSLGAIRTAVEGLAPADREDSRAVEVELFCEDAGGARITCGSDPEGEAAYVSIRLAEAWAPTLSYPLLRQTMALNASQTVRIR